MSRGRGKRSRTSVLERRMQQKEELGRVIKPKFAEEKQFRAKPLIPRNPKQKEYIEKINTNSLICATGLFGTSKTYIPTVLACQKYLVDPDFKIYLSRPNVSSSKSLGAMPGDIVEKMSYWLQPVLSTMKEQLGEVNLALALEKGNIQFIPLEVIKGASLSNCYVIVDEAEDLTWKEVKSVITRQGENSTFILAGDLAQSDLNESSGLKKLVGLIDKYPDMLDASHIDFNKISEIVRSQIARQWAEVFQQEGL